MNFLINLFIAASLIMGTTDAIFGSPARQENSKAHKKNKNEANLQGQGSTGQGIFTNIQVKPIFTGINVKRPSTSININPKETKVVPGKKIDTKTKTEISRMSINEVLTKFPNRQFTFVKQKQSIVDGADTFADKFIKYTKGTQKAPTAVAFARPGVCKPVDYCEDLGKLQGVHYGYIWPASITYPKCLGCCLDHQVAVPVNKMNRKVHILVIPYANPTESRLEQHEYEEHQSCKCECKVKADQCDKRTQTYDPYNCRCDCNPDAEVNSKCLPNQQWSESHCGCICKYPDTQCGSSKVWNEKTCTCDWKSHGGFGSFG